MLNLIVGLGNQGLKRKNFFKKSELISYDTKNKLADYNSLNNLPIQEISTAYLCSPDNIKNSLIKFFLNNHKNILVEKPCLLSKKDFNFIKKKIIKKKLIFYTAYNHRFEPHIIKLKNIIDKHELGKIYFVRIFYGNGTALLVRNSKWKDKLKGVVSDLGSHIIDIILFLFEKNKFIFDLLEQNNFENKTSDHAIFYSKNNKIKIFCETTLLMWKNTFTIDVVGKNGSVHLNGLCKWGPSILTLRKRKYPSGTPEEKIFALKTKDPTWRKEHFFFQNLIKKKDVNTSIKNLEKDFYISSQIKRFLKKIE